MGGERSPKKCRCSLESWKPEGDGAQPPRPRLWGSPKSRPGVWFVPARDRPGCKASAGAPPGLRPQGVHGAGAAGEKQGKPATAYLESVGRGVDTAGVPPELLAGQWRQSVQRRPLLPSANLGTPRAAGRPLLATRSVSSRTSTPQSPAKGSPA